MSNLLFLLIPLHGIAVATALVILERVGECGGVAAEGEVVARVGSKHHGTTHVETVEIAGKGCRGHRHLVVVEVITRGEADVPALTDAHIATDVECLSELVRIAHGLLVELLRVGVLTHRDAITKSE